MKLYVTKYSITTGCIELMSGEISPNYPEYFWADKIKWTSLRIGKEAFHTEAEAREAVAAGINKRTASLQKQIDKLNKLEITVKE